MGIKYCNFYCSSANQKKMLDVELNDPQNRCLNDIQAGIGVSPTTVIYNEKQFVFPDLFIVEDEILYVTALLNSFEDYLDLFDFTTIGIVSDNDTLARIAEVSTQSLPTLITLDFQLDDGTELTDTKQAEKNYDRIKTKFPSVPIIGITNFSQEDFAMEFIRKMRGNYDNVWPKTMIYKVLPSLIKDRLAIQHFSSQVEELTDELKTAKDQRDKSFVMSYFNGLPINLKGVKEVTINGKTPSQILASLNLGGGQAFATKCMFYQTRTSLNSKVFLVTGESGAGKDIIAQIIHNYSNQKGELKKFNCAELSGADPNIAAQKLFGAEKGEFQGVDPTKGWLDHANPNGTVFFDEIHHIPLEIQAKLLDVLRNGKYHSAGGKKEKKLINVKLVFATNRDLKKESEKVPPGMHHDFYNRINKITIKVPSLFEREEDFRSITECLIRNLNGLHGTSKTISNDAIKKLKSFDYRNTNIEKLHTILEIAITNCPGSTITPEWLIDPDNQYKARGTSFVKFNHEAIHQHLNRLKAWIPALIAINKDAISQKELADKLCVKQAMISQDLGSTKNENQNKIIEIIRQRSLSQNEVKILLKLNSFKTKFSEICKQHYTLNTA